VLPMAYIEHQIPGRMRLRVPERRGDGQQGGGGTIFDFAGRISKVRRLHLSSPAGRRL
jgi:hypothetical protein